MNILQICKNIQRTIESYIRPIFPTISTLIMLCSLIKRPGLSVTLSTANIISTCAKFGIVTDTECPDGQKNKLNIYTKVIVSEIFRALKEDVRIQGAEIPGSSLIMTNGANAGGPVVSMGTTLMSGNFVSQLN